MLISIELLLSDLLINFENSSGSATDVIKLTTGSNASIFTSSFVEGYDHAKTPFITSGFLDSTGTVSDLLSLVSGF